MGLALVVLLVIAALVVSLVFLGDTDAGSDATQVDPATDAAGSSVTSESISSTSTAVSSTAPPSTIPPAQPPVTSPVVTPAGPQSPGVALLLTDDGALDAVVVLQPTGQGGISLGMPADTLMKTAADFGTMFEVYASGEVEDFLSGLETILGVVPGAAASLEIGALEAALQEAGVSVDRPSEADTDARAARRAASAVLLAARLAGTNAYTWGGLPLEGDATAVQDAVAAMGMEVAGSAWEAAVLPGQAVAGQGFEYFEADVVATRQLLAVTGLAGVMAGTVLEVQNGSGAVRAAETAAQPLMVLGFTVLPFSNAPGFPDVQRTIISTSPGAAVAAQQIRTLLGAGEIAVDETLQPGHVVVVVGKDLAPSLPIDDIPSTSTAGGR